MEYQLYCCKLNYFSFSYFLLTKMLEISLYGPSDICLRAKLIQDLRIKNLFISCYFSCLFCMKDTRFSQCSKKFANYYYYFLSVISRRTDDTLCQFSQCNQVFCPCIWRRKGCMVCRPLNSARNALQYLYTINQSILHIPRCTLIYMYALLQQMQVIIPYFNIPASA